MLLNPESWLSLSVNPKEMEVEMPVSEDSQKDVLNGTIDRPLSSLFEMNHGVPNLTDQSHVVREMKHDLKMGSGPLPSAMDDINDVQNLTGSSLTDTKITNNVHNVGDLQLDSDSKGYQPLLKTGADNELGIVGENCFKMDMARDEEGKDSVVEIIKIGNDHLELTFKPISDEHFVDESILQDYQNEGLGGNHKPEDSVDFSIGEDSSDFEVFGVDNIDSSPVVKVRMRDANGRWTCIVHIRRVDMTDSIKSREVNVKCHEVDFEGHGTNVEGHNLIYEGNPNVINENSSILCGSETNDLENEETCVEEKCDMSHENSHGSSPQSGTKNFLSFFSKYLQLQKDKKRPARVDQEDPICEEEKNAQESVEVGVRKKQKLEMDSPTLWFSSAAVDIIKVDNPNDMESKFEEAKSARPEQVFKVITGEPLEQRSHFVVQGKQAIDSVSKGLKALEHELLEAATQLTANSNEIYSRLSPASQMPVQDQGSEILEISNGSDKRYADDSQTQVSLKDYGTENPEACSSIANLSGLLKRFDFDSQTQVGDNDGECLEENTQSTNLNVNVRNHQNERDTKKIQAKKTDAQIEIKWTKDDVITLRKCFLQTSEKAFFPVGGGLKKCIVYELKVKSEIKDHNKLVQVGFAGSGLLRCGFCKELKLASMFADMGDLKTHQIGLHKMQVTRKGFLAEHGLQYFCNFCDIVSTDKQNIFENEKLLLDHVFKMHIPMRMQTSRPELLAYNVEQPNLVEDYMVTNVNQEENSTIQDGIQEKNSNVLVTNGIQEKNSTVTYGFQERYSTVFAIARPSNEKHQQTQFCVTSEPESAQIIDPKYVPCVIVRAGNINSVQEKSTTSKNYSYTISYDSTSKVVKCFYCPEIFISKSRQQNHIWQKHLYVVYGRGSVQKHHPGNKVCHLLALKASRIFCGHCGEKLRQSRSKNFMSYYLLHIAKHNVQVKKTERTRQQEKKMFMNSLERGTECKECQTRIKDLNHSCLMLVHIGEHYLECKICKQQYLGLQLAKHMVNDHDYQYCEICNTVNQNISEHQEVCKRLVIPPCPHCNLTLTPNHLYLHHGENACPHCHLSFGLDGDDKYALHVSVEHDIMIPRYCQGCSNNVDDLNKAQHHLAVNHGVFLQRCQYCSMLLQPDRMISHEADHRYFPCPICGLKFMRRTHWEGHIAKHHGKHRRMCIVCLESVDLWDFTRHELKHVTGIFTEGLSDDLPLKEAKTKEQCQFCKKSLSLLQYKLSSQNETTYKCMICDKTFGKVSKWAKHVEKQHDLMLAECRFCEKTMLPCDIMDHEIQQHSIEIESCLDTDEDTEEEEEEEMDMTEEGLNK